MNFNYMSHNIVGYFRALDANEDNPNGTLYTVKMGVVGDTGFPDEVELDGESPFVVRYESSSTPYDPIRTSTATAKIVVPKAPVHLLTPGPQGSFCELYSGESGETLVWKGYLKSNLYNVPKDDCYDIIQMEASDCLASLQYLDYQTDNGAQNVRKIIDFRTLLWNITNQAGLSYFFWPNTKRNASGQTINPEELTISECNFFTSDTDEPWKWSEVLEELCKYMGFTAIQWGDTLVLMDYRNLINNSIIYGRKYGSNGWSTTNYGGYQTVNKEAIKLTGADLSYESAYNKISVRDNFYTVDKFIPDLFDEDLLENRLGEKWQSGSITPPTPSKPKFFKPIDVDKWEKGVPISGKLAEEETGDTEYSYYQKLWDNTWYESHYYTTGGTEVFGVHPTDMTDYAGGTLCTVAVDDNKDVKSSLNWTNYLLAAKMVERTNVGQPILNLKTGWRRSLINTGEYYLVLNAKALFTRYNDRPYINPDWCQEANYPALPTVWQGGGTAAQTNQAAKLYFAIGFGDWFWNGSAWEQNETFFEINVGNEDDNIFPKKDCYGADHEIVNTLSWTTFADGDGYAIPIPSNMPLDGEITFSIGMPKEYQNLTIYDVHQETYVQVAQNTYGGFCWLSDISLELTAAGAAKNREADVVFTTEITGNSVNEMGDIELKFTTMIGDGKPSFSTVGYNGAPIEYIWENYGHGGSEPKKPEINIMEKYVEQYSSPRMRETFNVGLWFTPFSQIVDSYWGNGDIFAMLGSEIDYANNRQKIDILEIV